MDRYAGRQGFQVADEAGQVVLPGVVLEILLGLVALHHEEIKLAVVRVAQVVVDAAGFALRVLNQLLQARLQHGILRWLGLELGDANEVFHILD